MRLIARALLFLGMCENLATLCTAYVISGCAFATKYMSNPTIDLYSHFSLKAGPPRPAPTGSPAVGVLTPFACDILPAWITFSIRPGCER